MKHEKWNGYNYVQIFVQHDHNTQEIKATDNFRILMFSAYLQWLMLAIFCHSG